MASSVTSDHGDRRGDGRPVERAAADAASIARRRRLLEDLRRRGARGGLIGQHRAMARARLTPWIATSLFVVPPLASLAMLFALPWLARAWRWFFERGLVVLELPGGVAEQHVGLGPLPDVFLPFPTTPGGAPNSAQWWVVGLLWAALVIASIALPQRFTPLSYLMRFGAFLQATAFVYFAFWGQRFPYELPPHLLGLVQTGAAVIVLVPVVLGATYFAFDVGLARKLWLVLLAVGHLAVLVPLQTLLQAAVVHRLSSMVLPAMFFFFGILLQVLVVVAFYGWGMSWEPRAARAAAPPGQAPADPTLDRTATPLSSPAVREGNRGATRPGEGAP